MRVSVDPQRVELAESHQFTIGITVANTGSVIGGYELRILGADRSWVTLETDTLSLFPDTSQTVTAKIDLPPGVGAGDRRIAVQVRELTTPQNVSVTEVELVVPPREAIEMSLSPTTVTCGKRGRYSVVTHNRGNAHTSVAPVGMDAETKIAFTFLPSELHLAPGERIISDLRASAKRRWFGSPVARPFSLAVIPPEDREDFLAQHDPKAAAKAKKAAARTAKKQRRAARTEQRRAEQEANRAAKRQRAGLPWEQSTSDRRRADNLAAADAATAENPAGATTADMVEPPPEPPEALAQGVMLQKPRLGRGLLSLIGLLTAVSVFAVVITIAMSRLVGVSAADRNLALEVASARTEGGATGSAVIGGTVKQLTDGSPVSGVTVELFDAGKLTEPIKSTATVDDGTWRIPSLPAGSYKIRYRGAGYAEVWYPNALTGAEAKAVSLDAGQQRTDLSVTLGGLPATVTGQVKGDDVAGSVLTVIVPKGSLQAAGGGATSAPGGGNSDSAGGVLRTIPIGSDGKFSLAGLPSPAVYSLVLSKPGFGTSTQQVDLSGGESRDGINLRLQKGGGSIAGTVTGPDGPIGGAVVTATSGDRTARTLTLTTGDHAGEFTLRKLATPATYTITVTAPKYAPVTSTLSLTADQRLKGVLLSLAKSSATLGGTVTTVSDGKPASGVTVTITSGSSEKITTVTQSGRTAGSWSAAGLPIPDTYTITFSRADLQPQTVAVAVNSAGQVTSGASSASTIGAAMRSAFGTITGKVSQQVGSQTQPVGEATVTLTAGDKTYTVTSASTPAKDVGRYQIGHVAPGTYTVSTSRKGTSPTSTILTVTAGQKMSYNPLLVQSASVSGTVTQHGSPLAGIEVDMYLASQYPAQVYAHTTTGPQGHYTFPEVDAPQAYVIEAHGPSGESLASDTIVLKASQAGVLDLAASSPGGSGGGP